MLDALKNLVGVRRTAPAATASLAGSAENDVTWRDRFMQRSRPSLAAMSSRFDFKVMDEWMLDEPCTLLLDAACRANFLAWVAALDELAAVENEETALRRAILPAEAVAELLERQIQEDRPVIIKELLSKINLAPAYHGQPFAQLMHEEIAVVLPWGENQTRIMLGALLTLSLSRADLLALAQADKPPSGSSSDGPELDFQQRKVMQIALAERRQKAQALYERHEQAPGRMTEDKQDRWVAQYWGLRWFNQRATAPVDHCGRVLKSDCAMAFKELSLELGVKNGELYIPNAEPGPC